MLPLHYTQTHRITCSLRALCYSLHLDLCQRSAQPTPIRLSINPILNELYNCCSTSHKVCREARNAARNFSTLTPQTSRVPFSQYSACSRFFTGGRTEGVRLALPLNQPLRVHRFPLRMAHLLCLVSRCYPFPRTTHTHRVSKPSRIGGDGQNRTGDCLLERRHATTALRPHV